MPFQLPEPESYFAVIQKKSCSILADVASLIKSPQCTLSSIPLQVGLWMGGGGGGSPCHMPSLRNVNVAYPCRLV